MAQTKTIQLLRSSQVYANLEAAKTGIQGAAGTRQDGELLLGRYWSGETNPVIKSVIGIYHKNPDLTTTETGTITAGWTFIQDITSSSEGLQHLQDEVDLIETALGFKEDGTKSGFDTANQDVILASDDVVAAIQKVANAIAGMDKAANAVNGQVVTTVSETNGVVSETKANVKDLQLGGYSKDTAATGAIGSTDTVNTALSKLENAIAQNTVTSEDGTVNIDATGSTTDLSVNIDGTTVVKNSSGVISSGLTIAKIESGLSTNVKEAYQLQNASGTQIGAQIDIYKDSALKEVYLGASTDTINSSTGAITKNTVPDPQSMNFAYQLADGTYSLTKIDVSKFLTNSEFGDGLQVSGGVVSVKVGNGLEIDDTSKAVNVKIDSTSDPFLTVGANGVKLDGVQDAIDAVKVTTDNTGATYVNLAVDNATGRALTLTNTMQAMATADSTHQGLAEASDVKTYVDNAVQSKNVSAKGDNYVSATAANNKVTVATDVQNLTFTQGSGSTDSTLSGTAQSLADGADIATKVSSFTNARISEEIAKLDSSVAATAEANNQYSVLTGVTETNGKLTAKTEVTLAAVAKTGAAADVSVADSGNLLTATNVEAALQEIAGKSNTALQSVSGSNAITVGTKTNNDQQISLKLDTSTGSNIATGTVTDMLTITDNGLAMNDTWDCGTF